MKFNPGDEVVIVGDLLNYGLPLDHHAVVMREHLTLSDCRNYLIRIPLKRLEYWVTEKDIELSAELNARQAEEALRNHLIDLALDKKDQALFEQVTKKDGAL